MLTPTPQSDVVTPCALTPECPAFPAPDPVRPRLLDARLQARAQIELDRIADAANAGHSVDLFDAWYPCDGVVTTLGRSRPKTVDEVHACGLVPFHEGPQLDARGDLRAQSVEWLRTWARRFAEAADRVEALAPVNPCATATEGGAR